MADRRRGRASGARSAASRVAVAAPDLAPAFAAAYRLLDRAWLHFERDARGAVWLALRPKGRARVDLTATFAAELEEQRRQLALAEHNLRLREAIVGRALFGDPAADAWDERADEGGPVPWAEADPAGGQGGGEGSGR